MQLISMHLSDKEKEEELQESQYPYGLCLQLDDEALQKLGIVNLPPTGVNMKLVAIVKVKSISQYEDAEGPEASMSLQITDMALSAPDSTNTATPSAEIAKALYG